MKSVHGRSPASRAGSSGRLESRRWAALVPALCAILAAACGGSETNPSSSGTAGSTTSSTGGHDTGGSTGTGAQGGSGGTSTTGGSGGTSTTGGSAGSTTGGSAGSTTGGGGSGGSSGGSGGAVVDCGNGVKDSGEDCDGADLGGKTCADFGFANPAGLACNGCVHDTSACKDNTAPQITSAAPTMAKEGETYYYAAIAKDAEGDAFVWTLPEGPAGMTILPDTGLLSWTPGPNDAGSVPVTVRVTDSGGSFSEQVYSLDVAGIASPPKITSTPPLVATPGMLYTYTAAAADPDSPMLTWSVTGPAGMAVSAAGVVTWNVPAGASGNYPVTLTVNDGANPIQQAFSIGVSAAGDATPPVVTITAPAADAKITDATNVTGTISDPALAGYDVSLCRTWGPNGNDCTVVKKGLAPVMNGVIATLDPSSLPNGQWDLTVQAKDAAGNTTTKTVSTVVAGALKRGIVRLAFTDLVLRTDAAQIELERVYDGLDLSKGQLGYGWRFEWNMGHFERPKQLQSGWVFSVCGFPPVNCVNQAYPHPVRFQLADGRTYEFNVTVFATPVISSIHELTPVYTETTLTGAKLRALDSAFNPYSQANYTLWESQGTIYEDFSYTPWEPPYYEITTEKGEILTYKASNFQIVKLVDPGGAAIDLSGPTVKVDGKNVVSLTTGPDGFVKTASDLTTGFSVQYTQDANGDLTGATTTTGAVQSFDYDVGHKLFSYQSTGLALETYEYDDRGRLTKHSFPNGAVEVVTYDDQNHVVTKKDAAGNTMTTAYDALGRVTSISDPLGHTTTFTYVGTTSREATRTDPLGHKWQYEYDAAGHRTAETNHLGEKTTYAFDPSSGRATQATDGEGRVFKETHDNQNRVTSFVLPNGQVARTFGYPNGQTMTSTDAQGHVETTGFDSKGRVTSFTDAQGSAWAIAYDDVAHTRTTTHPNGTSSVAKLDALDRVTQLTFNDGLSFNYKWGEDGTVDQVTRPDGLVQKWEKGPSGETTGMSIDGTSLQQITYDALGRVASESGPGGYKLYEYDAAGRMTTETGPAGSLAYGYDAADRVTAVQSPNGRDTTFEYDAANRLTRIADSAGRQKLVAYDKSSRPVAFTDELGRNTAVQYDANGNPAVLTLPDMRTVEYTYYPSDKTFDEGLQVQTYKDLDGVLWSFTYDGSGRVHQITDALSGVATFEYNPAGQVTKLVDPLSRTTTMTVGPNGLTGVSAPGGNNQSWTYGADGRVATWTRADSSVVTYGYVGDTTTMALPGGAVYSVTRDLDGTVTETGTGVTITTTRDLAGRVATVSRADGALLDVSYTAEGRVAGTTASLPGGQTFSTQYAYDVSGRPVAVTDPNGGVTQYGYDDLGRVTLVQYPNGTSAKYGYGFFNRPATIQHFKGAAMVAQYDYAYDSHGQLTSETTPEGAFEYAYDALGRLTTTTVLSGGSVVDTLTDAYDAAGNLLSRTTSAGTTTYAYSADDRLLSASGPDGTVTYSYNGRGALTQVASPSGTTVYAYDALDRLTQATLPGGQTIEYKYDVSGHLLGRTDAAGERRCLPLPMRPDGYDDCALTYGPGGADPIAYTFGLEGFAGQHSPAGSIFARTAARGTVVGLTGAGGDSIASRTYDAWGRIATSSGVASERGYLGERQDPATGLVYLRARWYDPRTGRFLTPDSAPAGTLDSRTLHRYAYASDDPVNRIDRSGEMSLGSCMSGISVQGILSSIGQVFQLCLKQKLVYKIYTGVAEFAVQHIIGFAQSRFDQFTYTITRKGKTITLGGEGLFQQFLADILCGRSEFEIMDDVEFEVKLNNCGERKAKSKKLDCGTVDDNGLPMQSYPGSSGVDIILSNRIPIELKWNAGSGGGPNQLPQRCRFAGIRSTYVAFYIYYDSAGFNHDGMARECWTCWSGVSCPNEAPFGSIYVAFSVKAFGNKQHVYIPEPHWLCGGKK